ncbi:hypothetical protein WJX79_005958 [Trebouxia sp. C0005]
MTQPRAKFAALEPSADQGDLIDDEVPGSVRADTPAATAQDLLPQQQQPAARGRHRAEAKAAGGPTATDTASGAGEGLQDSKELFNETGVPIEPFNLDREREEGHFDAGGGYIPHNFPQVKDAWLESVDNAGGVQGTGGDLSVDDPGAHPANDEYVQPAPPELPAQALKRYRQTVLELLHAGETVPAALRRLSEAGKLQGGVKALASPTLDQKLEKKLGGFGQDSGVHPAQKQPKKGSQTPSQPGSAASVPKDNSAAFERLTEAAEVLLDHGQNDVYSWTREQAQQQFRRVDNQQEQQPASQGSKSEAALPSTQPHTVDPQTYQASTAGELTYGKDKAHDMLKLKRQELSSEPEGGLAQPQDVTGLATMAPSDVGSAAQLLDESTQPSKPHQVKAQSHKSQLDSPQASSQPAPVINPVGASSNYTKQSLAPVAGNPTAALSSIQSQNFGVTGSNVDLASHGDAATAADEPGPETSTSRLDKPGLPDPQDNALPGYQVEALGRAQGQKAGARDQNKPQDLMGTPAEIGQGNLPGAPLGSAERPIRKIGATDVPHHTAVEPSHHQAPATKGKEDALYKQAASAFKGAVHQAGASLPFDKVAAGSIHAQGRKLTIVFWDEKFVYFRENRRVYEL